jgi:AcrR family transcriptional regulator
MVLTPSPVQQRAVATVRAAIDATVALIDELGEDRVRLQDVTDRSGVTNGSLIHHFGTRDALVAVALATRFDQAVIDRIRMFDELAGDAAAFGPQLARIMAEVSGEQRGIARRARFRALSFARHRPELRQVLAESFRPSARAIAERIAGTAGSSVLTEGTSPSALAVFAETYSIGLLLEDVLVAPLPPEEWQALFLGVMGAVIVPQVLDEVRTHAATTAGVDARAPRLRSATATEVPTDPAVEWPSLDLSEDERRVVDHAITVFHAHGDEGIVVREVCEATGVSRGWFARHLVGRDELIDLVRLDRFILLSRAEATVYERAFATASDAAALRAALAAAAGRSQENNFLVAAWDRLDLVVAVAATGHEQLARDAGEVAAVGLARIAAAVADAQSRGVVRADVPARAVARFIWGYPLALLLGELVEVPMDELLALADRTSATLLE